jgi:hypothetical protein
MLLMIAANTVRATLGSQVLNATSSIDLPPWLESLTERNGVAFPAHAAVGTVFEKLNLSPAATSLQWFKAAAHARSESELEQAAHGISAALARDCDDSRAARTLCLLQPLGNPAQRQLAQGLNLPCDRWPPNVILEADATPRSATVGSVVRITASVTSTTDFSGIVDVEVHHAQGEKIAQWAFLEQNLAAGQASVYDITWTVPANLPPGPYVVELGVFYDGWNALRGWRNDAQAITIASPS